MPAQNRFVEEVLERLRQSGEASARRMFGGHGIFSNGLMFALIADNECYLKADTQSAAFFVDENRPPFSYRKADGKVFQMSYYLAPEAFFEDPDETLLWANRARDAAARAPRKAKKAAES